MISLFRTRQRGCCGEASSTSALLLSLSLTSLSAAASAHLFSLGVTAVGGYPPEEQPEWPDDYPPPFACEDEQEDRDIFVRGLLGDHVNGQRRG